MNEHDNAKPTSERHVPVLKDRCINLLAPGFEAARLRGETPVAIDATLGMGGHSCILWASTATKRRSPSPVRG